jgi:hypothetical protein
LIEIATPSYLKERKAALGPGKPECLRHIAMRSQQTERIRERNSAGADMSALLNPSTALDDPEATGGATLPSLAVVLIAVPHAPMHLERGAIARLLRWYGDGGPIRHPASTSAARTGAS